MYCLQFFTTEDILDKHKENCMVINAQQAIKMPNKGEKLKKLKKLPKAINSTLCNICRF